METKKTTSHKPRQDSLENSPSRGYWLEWLLFAAVFLTGFAGLQAIYFFFWGAGGERVALTHLTLDPSVFFINAVTPGEHVLAQGRSLVSPYAGLAVRNGCEGSEGIFLLLAAIIAFKAQLRHKIWGAFLGFLLLSLLNVGRVVSLYYVLRFHKGIFGLLHGYLWPVLIVLAGGLYFLWWTGKQGKAHEPSPA